MNILRFLVQIIAKLYEIKSNLILKILLYVFEDKCFYIIY